MRKSLLVLSVFVVVLSFSIVSVGAQASPDVTALAAEFPADSAYFYGVVRTDDAFIDGMNAVLQPFYPYAEDLPPGFNLRDGINLALQDSGMDITFEEDIRPWLGGTAAVALFVDPNAFDETEFLTVDSAFEDSEGVVAIQITDRALAQDFVEDVFTAQGANIEAQTQGNYTTYEIPFGPIVALDDDTLFIAEELPLETFGILGGDFAPLNTSADFGNVLSALPTADYSVWGYVNVPVVRGVVERVANDSIDEFGKADANESLAFIDTFGIGSVGGGLTSLDANTLAADVTILGGASYLNTDLGSIDPAFAALIPSTTPFVVHGTNLTGTFQTTVDALVSVAEDSEDAEEITEGIEEINAELQAETGLTLDDVFGWMVNDYAVIARPSDSALGASSIFGLIGSNPLDVGLLIDASADTAAAVNVVDAIEQTATGALAEAITEGEDADVDLELTREANILTLTIVDNSGELPFPVELQVGVAGNVFFIGTPGIASNIVAGDGGLGSTANFTAATNTILPDSNSVYYLDFDNLAPIVDIAENFAEEENAADIATLREVLALFSTATISQSVDADGNANSRATITLSN